MKKSLAAVFVLSLSGIVAGQNGSSALDAAVQAMGTRDLTSIMFTGTGSTYTLGQAVSASSAWPRQVLKNYVADVTYSTPASRLVTFRTNPDGTAPFGGTTQVQFVSGADAWNLAATEDAPPPGRGGPGGPGPGGPGPGGPGAGGPGPGGPGAGGPPAGGPPAGVPPGGGPGGPPQAGRGPAGGPPRPQGIPQPPATAADRRLQIWLTAPGFIKAAQANNATVTAQGRNKLIAFTMDGQKFTGVLDAQNLLTKSTTWIDNPVLGDVAVETTYANYQTFEGIKFPTHVVQSQGGYPVLDLTITQVKPNQAVPVAAPPNIRTPPPAAPPVIAQSQKLGDGLWLLPTSHNSLVVEFADHIVVIEGPLSDARSDFVIAEAHRLVPNKPIRYVVNTHQHFDHSGGLRTFAAEGATIVTASMYKPYYERVFALPHTLNPDKLAKSGKKAVVEGVNGKRVMMDATRTIELYVLQPSDHNAAMMVVYLPKEKILVNADLFTPPPADAAPPAMPAPLAVALYNEIQRLKLDVTQIVPIHGQPGPYASLPRAVGKG